MPHAATPARRAAASPLLSLVIAAVSLLVAVPQASAFALSRSPGLTLGGVSSVDRSAATRSVLPLLRRPRNRAGAVELKALEFAQPEFATYPQQIFTVVNFVVLPFWAAMIVAPKNAMVKKAMESSVPILIAAALHLSLVLYGLSQPGSAEEFQFLATQGFVKLSAMQEMRVYPVFVSEEWAHVLAWDLFVGRWIYLDGLEKEVPTPFSLMACFILGPVGMTAHLLTRAVWLKDPSSILKL
mmetsp:Transcript_5240/g.12619  ORF Transcript_5240/g.12619 Transcript_5240/m.12619 type:complete len:241 (+) Transcript_5240:30-752(+)|eukprot:CAMPEP_0180120286 /NCGR_PEP_ID=MMETSP0986-20121125/2437_1 /TAXON_ID=697907 /ORGANISM="non described non described, Strain CCMP2293" /LENGTH=240 /DNA_ID=CAMNT_0022059349 /DNA_START=28 /DNA_END=750 /DNA_ORIENTATION=+